MRRFFLISCLIFLTVTLHAQDEHYRLITPTLDDYVALTNEYGAELLADESPLLSGYFYNGESIAAQIGEIFIYLYPDDGTYEQLRQIYDVLEFGKNESVPRNVWSQRMIQAWIAENNIDLSIVDELQFDDFYITVIPRDFNADGVDEYLLDVMKGTNEERNNCGYTSDVVDYLVVQQTDSGYHFVETHLPWNGYTSWIYGSLDGGMIEIDFDDINADGLPEWVVLNGGDVAGGMSIGYFNVGELIILSWRDNGIKILTPEREVLTYSIPDDRCENGVYPTDVEWKFNNVDDDAPLEILQIEIHGDNWYCQSTITEVFDWDIESDQYIYSGRQIEYADSQHCRQRDAEEMMWTGDYAAAIPLYEQALTLERDTYPDYEYGQRMLDKLYLYLRARLALAYLMTEQSSQAESLLQTLVNEEPADEAIMQFANVLMTMNDANATPLSTCVEAYRVLTESYPDLLVGFTGSYYDASYDPARVGCDAPGMLRDILSHQQLSLDVSPIDTLSALGIDTVKVLETDLNHDGLSEWLIISDIIGMELFFAPDGDVYRVSYPRIDPFMKSSDMQGWGLPDGSSAIAITVTYDNSYEYFTEPWRCVYEPICGPGGGGYPPMCRTEDSDYYPHTLYMWRLDDAQLINMFQMSTCEEYIDDFPGQDGLSELSVMLVRFDEDSGEELFVRPTVYAWNADEHTYEYQSQPRPIAVTPVPTREPQPYYSVGEAFDKRDFEAVVQMTRNTVTIEEDEHADAILDDYFYRALSLQALGRDDEALAVFVAIHDIAPNHIWGILAQLHFEVVE